MEVLKGLSTLMLVLIMFYLFSSKAYKGEKAMTGLAGAAVATFLVEAIYKYILGDAVGIVFATELGKAAGSVAGIICAILVMLKMDVEFDVAAATGAAVFGFGILPGFVAGYLLAIVYDKMKSKLNDTLKLITILLLFVPLARFIAVIVNPIVTKALTEIGITIVNATAMSPIFMGFLLGGIITVISTSPLSSMALTAMLSLKGIPMGIGCIACVGGAFANGMMFLKIGIKDKSKLISLMLEPLTQADLVTKNSGPLYTASFIGGGLSGIVAVMFKIKVDAPGTASSIPGFFTPFAFNEPIVVTKALIFSIIAGILGGFISTYIYGLIMELKIKKNFEPSAKNA